MKKQGWFRQSTRHALASHGIPTKYENKKRVRKRFKLKDVGFRMKEEVDKEVFDKIKNIFSDLGVYLKTSQEDDIYVFEFYKLKKKKSGGYKSSSSSKAEIDGNEIHINVSSGKEYDKVMDIVALFNYAGYYFDVEWSRDDFSIVFDFSEFYDEEEWNKKNKKSMPKSDSNMGTRQSKLMRKILEE